MRRIEPGTKVRLTGKFLANTGQTRGGEGASKWQVLPCQCRPCVAGDWIAIDEPREVYPDEIAPQFRHLARGNVEICK
jgi:hypothetical protein